MKKMLICYNSRTADKGTESYIRAIKRQIDRLYILDICSADNIKRIGDYINPEEFSSFICLKPMDEKDKEHLDEFLYRQLKLVNLENINGITATAEAILEEIEYDLKGKSIMVVNQSETVGKSVVNGIIDRYGTVLSCNEFTDINTYIDIGYVPDILITATGSRDFVFPLQWSEKINKVIDLSEDTLNKNAVRHISTAKILKKRFENLD